MKKSILAHIQYRLPAYIVIIALPIVVWSIVFSILARPKYNEMLTVEYFGKSYDITASGNEIRDSIDDITDCNIKKIDFRLALSDNGGIFSQVVEARLYSSDILIFEGGIWTDEILKSNLMPIPDESMERLSSMLPEDAEFYTIDGAVYGVILSGNGKVNRFTEHMKADGAAIAVFSNISVNASGIYGVGDRDDSAAIDLICYLLSNPSGRRSFCE